MTARRLAAAALLVASVLAIVWSAGALRSTTAYDKAVETAARLRLGQGDKGDVERATEAVERSRSVGPDTRARRAEALLLLATGRPRRAAALAEAVVAEEPENLDAWGILFQATRRLDPGRSREALRRARELNPLTGRSGR
jgi:predicted Zn-dependent protease